jgi:hypothetical protein
MRRTQAKTGSHRALLAPLILCATAFAPASAFDHGFDPSDPVVQWFEHLRRPDVDEDYLGVVSCCGKGDAYAVDVVEDGGADREWAVKITDGSAIEFPDGTTRQPLPDGTVSRFPGSKVIKPNQGNPTKHAWVFISVWSGQVHEVWCFVPLPPNT